MDLQTFNEALFHILDKLQKEKWGLKEFQELLEIFKEELALIDYNSK